MKTILKGGIVGVLSGIVVILVSESGKILDRIGVSKSIVEFIGLAGLGIIYGLVTATFFIKLLTSDSENSTKSNIVRFIGWVIFSGISFWVAMFAAMQSIIPLFGGNFGSVSNTSVFTLLVRFAMSGFIGALILVIGFNLLFKRLSLVNNLLVCFVGSAVAYLCFRLFNLSSGFFYYILYISWQTAVTIALTYGAVNTRRTVIT